ncbi:MAG: D-alanyl-D-alanine carboxypeptidase/D-alanyl-D-alanine-endopeptidase [Pyrinomonadaceae bacterium]
MSVFLLLVLFLASSRRFVDERAQANAARPQASAAKEAAPAVKTKPAIAVSTSSSDRELAQKIDSAIDGSEFTSARWGVYLISLRDGRVLYARNADMLFTPASNMKIYTTAVALDMLGADYRWRTSVYASAQPDANGTIKGDLVLYGRGTPDLSSRTSQGEPSSLAQLADALYQRGVRRVRGNLVGDETYFRGEPLGDGWLWNDIQWYYGAEASALSVNGNEVMLTIAPSNKTGEPANLRLSAGENYFHLTNDTNTAERNAPPTIGINRALSGNELRVWGDFPLGSRGYSARLSVHNPAQWTTALFLDALRARGISVDGDARVQSSRVSEDERFDPQKAVELASVESKTLGEIARATNKESINLNAELILRTLGKERGALAPDPNLRRMLTRGDAEAGAAVVLMWLARAGISTEKLALHDGSGLSRLDLVTPETTARLLAAISKSPAAEIFRDSLPIAGRDGTLEMRLRAVAGRIHAKTGALSYDNSLSGYAMTGDEEPLVFSIMCNDETTKASSIRLIDEIATLVATFKSGEK